MIENACICTSAHSNNIVALLTPNDKQLSLLADQLGKSYLTRQEICNDPEVLNLIQKTIEEQCLESGLHRRETPVRIYLSTEEWTPDNELLTAAMKLKRKNVLKHYQTQIDELFKE